MRYRTMEYCARRSNKLTFSAVILIILITLIPFSSASAEPMHWLDEIEEQYLLGNWDVIANILQNNTPHSRIERAGYHFYRGKISLEKDEMISALEESARIAPESMYGQRALTKLANISLLERDYNQSLIYLLRVDPQMILDRDYLLSSVYLKLERYPEAIRAAQYFIKITKDSIKRELSYLQIVEAYLLNRQYHQALLTLETMRNQNYIVNQAAIIDFKEGYCYENTNLMSEAIEKYKSVIINYPYTEHAFQAEKRLSDISITNGGIKPVDIYTLERLPAINNNRPTERPPDITDPRSEFFYIQVNAFIEEKNASSHSSYLRNLGYDNIVFPKVVSNQQLYVVAVGPFPSRDAAAFKQTELKNNLNLDSFIIRY